MFSTEANLMQFLFDMKILQTHHQYVSDVTTETKIGGVGAVVQVEESKFGKRKYHHGRMVEGTCVLGGIQRETNHYFLVPCPGNLRNEASLLGPQQQIPE
jgi:hypothetical protein